MPKTEVLLSGIIANSQTIAVGDAVQLSSGFVIPATGTGSIYGIVTEIVTGDGTPVITDGTVGAELGTYRSEFTVAADNQTNAQVAVKLNVSKEIVYSAPLDATSGTTVGSDLKGTRFDLVNENTIDESDVTGTQFFSHGVDPEDSSRVLVNILDSAVYGA